MQIDAEGRRAMLKDTAKRKDVDRFLLKAMDLKAKEQSWLGRVNQLFGSDTEQEALQIVTELAQEHSESEGGKLAKKIDFQEKIVRPRSINRRNPEPWSQITGGSRAHQLVPSEDPQPLYNRAVLSWGFLRGSDLCTVQEAEGPTSGLGPLSGSEGVIQATRIDEVMAPEPVTGGDSSAHSGSSSRARKSLILGLWKSTGKSWQASGTSAMKSPARDLAARSETWDDDLERSSEAWAQQCLWEHGPPSLLMSIGGQNLAVALGQSWYDEVKDYTYPYPHECNPFCPDRCSGPMCTHYTQIVWATTTKVGSAR
ncbi:unnamed protein product [Ranitomeya imitator]|uniref:SCP domain-containing protein n=1 Tax=Ranitomeya imitator TaxID=111125 RepID=A0ABN9M5E3_9NEOB|nr:unnamed protein product [Ranitomeya imitator]